MQCIAPLRIIQKGSYILVPCGKCNFCLQNRRIQWSFRNQQQLKDSHTAHFITLTYKDEEIPTERDRHNTYTFATLKKEDLKRFHKNLRNAQEKAFKEIKTDRMLNEQEIKRLKKKWQLKYYSTGEYGSKRKRPHYHCLLFNLHPRVLERLEDNEIWNKGTMYFGEVNEASIQYVTKYLIDADTTTQGWDERQRPFSIMSKGIGIGYLRKKHFHKARGDLVTDYRFYCLNNGHKVKMPRYYKEKIYTKIERTIAGQQAMERQEEETEKRIKELEEYYGTRSEAVEKYEEQIQHQYEMIRIKSLNSNKL
ncbi:MAG: replication initiator protein [Microviridae sp.]|nr:MAG: replication initiator protein [Microviridae sp.]